MKKIDTTISTDTLWRSWLEELIEKDLGKFLIQQNEIQFLLTSIIILRIYSKGLLDKELKKELQKSTLGKLIKFFQTCAQQGIEEAELLRGLKEYNSLRNKLVHYFLESLCNIKIDKVPSLKTKEIYLKKLKIKEAMEIGEKILSKLFSIFSEGKKNFSLGK
jgi:hypothetical protein